MGLEVRQVCFSSDGSKCRTGMVRDPCLFDKEDGRKDKAAGGFLFSVHIHHALREV